jgi:hypothetical protein
MLRDAHLEMERLIDADAADILPSAKRELIEVYSPLFKKVGDDLVYGGRTIEDFIKTLKTEKPHCFPSAQAVDLQEQAFGSSPTLKSRGALYNEVGAANYAKLAEQWGCDASLRPGKAPAGHESETKKPSLAARRDNPFSKQGWNITKQGALVKSLGIEKAAAIAKSVGVKIGDTKFNPDYN